MKKLSVSAPFELHDAVSNALFEAGAQGLQEESEQLVTYVETDDELAALCAAVDRLQDLIDDRDAPITYVVEAADASWQDVWQKALEAVAITDDWVLRPTHHAPAPESERTIWFQPQASFGDGSHPTTQLCARSVCAWLRKGAGQTRSRRVLDVGTGNGVLSLLALKEADLLGIEIDRLLAIDIDEVAVQSFRQNLALNQLSEDRVELRSQPLGDEGSPFDLIAANISTPVLCELAPVLSRNLADDGVLLLTGLLSEDEPLVSTTFGALGLTVTETHRQGEWSLLTLRTQRTD